MIIRPEAPTDHSAIRSLTTSAFTGLPHSSQTEAAIVDALRVAGALTISLVGEQDGAIVGQVAFSPVLIDGEARGWFGLGPVSVAPALQRGGIGSALIRQGLEQLMQRGAAGSVVLGDPGYYRRFGFTTAHALRYSPAPPEYFQSLLLAGPPAAGEVTYHEAFEAR